MGIRLKDVSLLNGVRLSLAVNGLNLLLKDCVPDYVERNVWEGWRPILLQPDQIESVHVVLPRDLHKASEDGVASEQGGVFRRDTARVHPGSNVHLLGHQSSPIASQDHRVGADGAGDHRVLVGLSSQARQLGSVHVPPSCVVVSLVLGAGDDITRAVRGEDVAHAQD